MTKIKLERLLSNTPIPILGDLKFHQPTLQEIVDMGEEMYWSMIKIWCLDRKDMVVEENEQTRNMSDLDIWKAFVFNSPDMQMRFIASVDCFLNRKVEFLPTANTIIIGEDDTTKVVVDEAFYSVMRDICLAMSSLGEEKKEEQYRETENMSEREKALIRKMKARQEQLNAAKNSKEKVESRLAKQIVSLVAIGEYTFDEVYSMTLIQMVYLLKKYTAIQQYVLYTGLSPYMDSKKSKPVEHWLDA